jgi:hypothetical protein
MYNIQPNITVCMDGMALKDLSELRGNEKAKERVNIFCDKDLRETK